MTTVTITQSNYLPWRGYFSQIVNSEFFVFLDNVQFTTRDWRTRNRIRTPQGYEWLNIPILKPESRFEKIENIKILNQNFLGNHLETIRRNYSRAKHFDPNWEELSYLLYESYDEKLSIFNQRVIKGISKKFSINCQFLNANQFRDSSDPTQRLLNICLELKATRYLTGAKARDYLDIAKFFAKGIEIVWADFEMKNYPQMWERKFDSNVSVIDLILNVGFKSEYLKP